MRGTMWADDAPVFEPWLDLRRRRDELEYPHMRVTRQQQRTHERLRTMPSA